jgi:hypothetical protein
MGAAAPGFSLVDGGLLCGLMRRRGWTHPDGRLDYLRAGIVMVCVAWGPLLLAALSARLAAGHWIAIDWGIHVRLLIAIPLLLRADVSLHVRTRLVVDQLVTDGWAVEESERFDRIVAGAARRRDSLVPEVLFLGTALVASQVVVWNLGSMAFVAHRVTMERELLAARWWYALVALPLFQFLVYRALWRWAIWVQMLWRLSRLRLRPIALHPDLAGGLEFLSWPSLGFAYVIAALAATQAGVWADQVLHAGMKVMALKSNALVFVVAAVIVAVGPLIVVSGHLWRCQLDGRAQYGSLAIDYVRRFHARWIARGDRPDLLGTADIQSLADLGNAFEVVARTRLLPFGPRTLIAIVVAAVLPMIPVALLGVPLPELLGKLAGAFLGKPG